MRLTASVLLGVLAFTACDTAPMERESNEWRRYTLQFASGSDTVYALTGDTVVARVAIRDTAGVARDTTGLPLLWTVSDERILAELGAPRFIARDTGNARIAVTWGERRGEMLVLVLPTTPSAPGVASIYLVGEPTVVTLVGDTIRSALGVLDEFGTPRSTDGLPIAWGSTDDAVVRNVAPGVWVTASAGTASLRARLYGLEARRDVRVLAVAPPVAVLRFNTDTIQSVSGSHFWVDLTLLDAGGNELEPALYAIAYQSSNPAVATVNSLGMVTLIATGRARIHATLGLHRDSVLVSVMSGLRLPGGTTLTIYDGSQNLNVGDSTQLRLVTERDGVAFYWGGGADEWESLTPEIARISPTGMLTAIAPGIARVRAYLRGLIASDERTVLNTDGPFAELSSVSVGAFISCGTQRDGGALLCWGDPAAAHRMQITERTPPNGYTEARVGTNTRICGVTVARRLECTDGSQSPPGLSWRSVGLNVDEGTRETAPRACGLAADSTGVCWFGGDSLTLPHGTAKLRSFAYTGKEYVGRGRVCSVDLGGVARCSTFFGTAATPTVVAGLPSVVEVGIGNSFECFRTASGEVWCQGSNIYGQLGTGTTGFQLNPVKVANGLPPMASLAIEAERSCGISQVGDAWCWNGIAFAVTNAGGVSAVSTGVAHSCALKPDGSAWCWGYNSTGGLGDLTQTASPQVAKRVRGPTAQ